MSSTNGDRSATPTAFADLLIRIARDAEPEAPHA